MGSERPKDDLSRKHGEAPTVCKFSGRHTLRKRTGWGPKGWAVSCLCVWVTEMGELWVGMADPASGRQVCAPVEGWSYPRQIASLVRLPEPRSWGQATRVPPPPLAPPPLKTTLCHTPARASGCPSGFSSLSKNISLHPTRLPQHLAWR